MALPFNPFEKKSSKKQYTKVKVYENAPLNENQSIDTKSIDISTDIKNKKDLSIENNKIKDDKIDLNIEKIENKYLNKKSEDLNIEKIENKLFNKDRINNYISTNNSFNFDLIVGLQKRAMILIFEHCKQIGSKETKPLGINFFTEKLGTSQLNAHNVLNELIKKKVIYKAEFKRGRGGFSRFGFEDSIWNIINLNIDNSFKNYRNLNIEQTIETELSSNSEFKLINKTITEEEKFLIPENLKLIGVGQKQLSNIKNLNVLSTEEIQGSLDHYSFDLLNGLKPNLSLLFGVLRKGSVYVSQKYSLSLNDEIQREIQRIELAKEQEKQLKQNELFLKFQEFKKHNPEWYQELKSRQRFEVSPEIFENLAFQEWKMINE